MDAKFSYHPIIFDARCKCCIKNIFVLAMVAPVYIKSSFMESKTILPIADKQSHEPSELPILILKKSSTTRIK